MVDDAIPAGSWSGPLRNLECFDGSYNRFTHVTSDRLRGLKRLVRCCLVGNVEIDDTVDPHVTVDVGPRVYEAELAFGDRLRFIRVSTLTDEGFRALIKRMCQAGIMGIRSLIIDDAHCLHLRHADGLETVLDLEHGVTMSFGCSQGPESLSFVRFHSSIAENIVDLTLDGRPFILTYQFRRLRRFRMRSGWLAGPLTNLLGCTHIDLTGTLLVTEPPWVLFHPGVEELRLGFVRFLWTTNAHDEVATIDMPRLRALDVSGLLESGSRMYVILRSFVRRRFPNLTDVVARRSDATAVMLLLSVLIDTVYKCTVDLRECDGSHQAIAILLEKGIQLGSFSIQ